MHAGKIAHRTRMEIKELPEPGVYLFIPRPAARFLPYLNSVSKGLPLTHLIKQCVNTSSALQNEGHSVITPWDS